MLIDSIFAAIFCTSWVFVINKHLSMSYLKIHWETEILRGKDRHKKRTKQSDHRRDRNRDTKTKPGKRDKRLSDGVEEKPRLVKHQQSSEKKGEWVGEESEETEALGTDEKLAKKKGEAGVEEDAQQWRGEQGEETPELMSLTCSLLLSVFLCWAKNLISTAALLLQSASEVEITSDTR